MTKQEIQVALDNTIYYRMDTYSPRSNAIQMDSIAGYGYGCGASG